MTHVAIKNNTFLVKLSELKTLWYHMKNVFLSRKAYFLVSKKKYIST